MKRVPWMRKSLGLNNRIDPIALMRSQEDGSTELSMAVNIVHDYTGTITRRLGYEVTSVTTASHSMFYDDGVALFVTGDALSVLHGDDTSTPIRNVTPNRPVAYQQIGSKVYYCNGVESGYVEDELSYPWDRLEDPKFRDTTLTTIDIPVGTVLGYHGGRVLIGVGRNIWMTDRFSPNVLRPKMAITLPSPVRMIQPVATGVFVGTNNCVYFYEGPDFSTAPERKVSNEPPILGTDTVVDGNDLAFGKLGSSLMPIWGTRKGVFVGTREGTATNLTGTKLELPFLLHGSALCTKDKYVFCAGSGIGSDKKLAVCLELGGLRLSQFFNYHFDSLMVKDSDLYGAKSDGIFKLDSGDLDVADLISAKFSAPSLDLTLNSTKVVDNLIVGWQSDGTVRFTIQGNNQKTEIWRDLVSKDKRLYEHGASVPFGRDTRGEFLKLQIENLNGSDFTIASVDAMVRVIGQKLEMGV